MKAIENIAYAPEHGGRGIGDLLLPDDPRGAPPCLCIHGGGWTALDKESWAGVAALMCEQGFAAFNINYRLLGDAPWPACGDDCVRAAAFLMGRGHEAMDDVDTSAGLVVIGGSAGGHLTLWTALQMPGETMRAAISVAGPSDLTYRARHRGREVMVPFFGVEGPEQVTDPMLLAASPLSHVKPGAPPLLCVHSTNDELVPIEHSRRMVDASRAAGCRAELFAYPGPGKQHGIWNEDLEPRRLLPDPAGAVVGFLRTV